MIFAFPSWRFVFKAEDNAKQKHFFVFIVEAHLEQAIRLSVSQPPLPLLILRKGLYPNPRPFPFPGDGMQPLPSGRSYIKVCSTHQRVGMGVDATELRLFIMRRGEKVRKYFEHGWD